ncbi:hypothetical protein BYT27DRAFT_7339984 [Phlegmacium glaucopus]|nr:hypothetical protein BYT27DRAFT_7339984 [Phlegmacium glaucopus]
MYAQFSSCPLALLTIEYLAGHPVHHCQDSPETIWPYPPSPLTTLPSSPVMSIEDVSLGFLISEDDLHQPPAKSSRPQASYSEDPRFYKFPAPGSDNEFDAQNTGVGTNSIEDTKQPELMKIEQRRLFISQILDRIQLPISQPSDDARCRHIVRDLINLHLQVHDEPDSYADYFHLRAALVHELWLRRKEIREAIEGEENEKRAAAYQVELKSINLPNFMPSDDALTVQLIHEVLRVHGHETFNPNPQDPFHLAWVNGMNTAIQLQREKARRLEARKLEAVHREATHKFQLNI